MPTLERALLDLKGEKFALYDPAIMGLLESYDLTLGAQALQDVLDLGILATDQETSPGSVSWGVSAGCSGCRRVC